MTLCYFVSDLHGNLHRYRILLNLINRERPAALFIGGDILPSGVIQSDQTQSPIKDFINDFLVPELTALKITLSEEYPRIFLILGNDDPRIIEKDLIRDKYNSLWTYIHRRWDRFEKYPIFGYSYIPPTPFLLKDWERYDVSRYLDPGSIAPENGWFTIPNKSQNELNYFTIQEDLNNICGNDDLSNAILIFHSPPYKTNLDRASLDNMLIDHVPLDVHIGSIAIKKFIDRYQPLLTLHGHVHESVRITGSWVEKTGRTTSFSAAHDGPELSLIRFDPNDLATATRELINLPHHEM